MPLDWSPFVAFVRRRDRFLLTTHVRPDGDGLGALQALAEALEQLGKTVHRVIPSQLPQRYDFLDPDRRIAVFTPPGERYRDCDAIVVLDTGTWNQLPAVGDFLRASSAEKVVIDHHRTQDDLGATRFVDVGAEACGRLAYEAISALGVPVSPSMARSLFVALAMDTGWFRHSNTTAPTFALAGQLTGAGAEPTAAYEELFERNSLGRQKLKGRVLDRLTLLANGRVAHSEVRFSDYAETGSVPLDTEDLVNDLSVMGVEVRALFLEQREGSVKVSFRSRRVDVARLAEQFGGGGHRQASGATVSGPLPTARERVLRAVLIAVAELET
jgi:phosphoesterase RecJ-like protein